MKWSKNCALTTKVTREADPDADPPVLAIKNLTDAQFLITDCKLYVPVVTLSSENENKLFEQLKTGFKITIEWNKYRYQISHQTLNNNSNYLINHVFDNVNILFALAFENEEDRSSFSNYYTPAVEIKDYNV